MKTIVLLLTLAVTSSYGADPLVNRAKSLYSCLRCAEFNLLHARVQKEDTTEYVKKFNKAKKEFEEFIKKSKVDRLLLKDIEVFFDKEMDSLSIKVVEYEF